MNPSGEKTPPGEKSGFTVNPLFVDGPTMIAVIRAAADTTRGVAAIAAALVASGMHSEAKELTELVVRTQKQMSWLMKRIEAGLAHDS